MASWSRKNGKYVYVYYQLNGKTAQLKPRSLYSHLDKDLAAGNLHNIDAWVENWGDAHEVKPTTTTLTDAPLIVLVTEFCAYLTTRAKLTPDTIREHRANLLNYALPYLAQHDRNAWPSVSIHLVEHLERLEKSGRVINKVNISLRRFWLWLIQYGKVNNTSLPLCNVRRDRAEETPLAFTVSPDDILNHNYATPTLRLMAYLGYFCSLRPGEVFAVRRGDFRWKAAAAGLECCKVMQAAGLYGGLALRVSRQRAPIGKGHRLPKAGSVGYVACFDSRAAEFIAQMFNELATTTDLCGAHGADWWFTLWRRGGYPEIALKDLRRASMYWLGHYGVLDFSALKSHARHKDPKTLMRYLRRPTEEVEAGDGLIEL